MQEKIPSFESVTYQTRAHDAPYVENHPNKEEKVLPSITQRNEKHGYVVNI